MKRIIEVEEHVLYAYNILRRVGTGVKIAYVKQISIIWSCKLLEYLNDLVLCDISRRMESYGNKKRKVALKKIFDAFRNGIDAQRAFREMSFLLALEPHPLIINLLKIHPSSNGQDLYLVFPFIRMTFTCV